MNGLKNVVTGGWHPEKSGHKESWRGDFKGINQIAGWVGKGKDTSATPAPPKQHRATPLSTLKDPVIYGPPPKNVRYHGQEALSGTPVPRQADAGAINPEGSPEPQQYGSVQVHDEPDEAGPPPAPLRTPTGGSSPTAAPRLPPRRVTTDGMPARAGPPVAEGKPSLPPRLPPRAGTIASFEKPAPNEGGPAGPATGSGNVGQANHGALGRLGKAGISVPGLNIGSRSSPPLSDQQSAEGTSETLGNDGAKTNEVRQLSSRFSKLSSSSPSSTNAEPPATGTSFAQKQAALRSISSFQKDPTSVSMTDAKAAASTANNFRQRHGAQVAQGWQAANELNTKYGVVDRMNAQASTGNDSVASHTVDAPPSAGPPGQKSRPPPPPPPPKRRDLSDAAAGSLVPPPLPLANRPHPLYAVHASAKAQVSTSIMPKDLDLQLDKLWFAGSPQRYLPPALARAGDVPYSGHIVQTQGRRKTSRIMTTAILWTRNAAVNKFRLTWDAADPRRSVRAEQKYLSAPRPSPARLARAQHRYGRLITRWCQKRKGTRVGDGECWTLAYEALKAVADQCRSRGEKPVMASQGHLHGACIFSRSMVPSAAGTGSNNNNNSLQAAGVAEGDIMALTGARFQRRHRHGPTAQGEPGPAGGGGVVSTCMMGPEHTAIITAVHGNNVLEVLEQNVPPLGKKVQSGTYRVDELVQGEMRIYRPMPEGWIPFNLDW